MKKLPLVLGLAAAAGVARAAAKRLKLAPAPEGSWKDVSSKPSTNGTIPG